MPLFTSVLCAVDFSAHSARALVAAEAVARAYGASLTAVTVVDPLLVQAAALAYDLDTAADQARADLVEFAVETLGDSAQRVTPLVATGRPAREILRAAEATRADLIAMGTHGLGGVRKLFFGSTTERVLHDAGLAILAVPQDTRGRPPLSPIGAVLACVAMDRPADLLLRDAASVAAAFEADLLVAHVMEPLQLPPRFGREDDAHRAERRTHAETQLRDLIARASLGDRGRMLLLDGPADVEIAHAAMEQQAGLVVVGLGRASAIERRPGTTAYRIVCAAPVPVLALPERSE